MILVLPREARADVAEAATWYSQKSFRAAELFLVATGSAFFRVAGQAKVIDTESGVRRAMLRKFPHRVLYLIEGDKVVVIAVMHQRRDDLVWRERLE